MVGSALLAAGGSVVGTRHLVTGVSPLAGYLAAYAGLTVLVLTWLSLGAALLRGVPLDRATAHRLLAAWSAPLAVGAPLYSRDVFSYVAQGRLADLGFNPYRTGPVSLGPGPYLSAVSEVWRSTRAPYGPLFVGVERFVVHVAPNVMSAAFGMRLVALVGVALVAVFLPRLARAHGASEPVALWLALLNPLLLVHLVGGAHNEALMIGLLVAGLAVAADGRPTVGLVLCTLAAAVKIPALLGVIYLVADQLATRRGADRRKAAAVAAAVAGGTFLVVTAAVGYGWGWVTAVGSTGRVRTSLSPSTAVGAIADRLGAGSASLTASRLVGVAAALVVVAVLFALRHRLGSGRMLAVSMLVVVALGPVVQPWYPLWGLVLLAATGPGRALPVLVWVSAVLPFLALPDGTSPNDVVLFLFVSLTLLVTWLTVPQPHPAVEAA
jgi:alpha-1,6-mannosyltransferase